MIAHFNNTQKGIVYALIGYTAFSFNDVNAKWLVGQFPPMQVACLQALTGAIFFLCVNHLIGGWRGAGCKKERKLHIMRGFINAALSIVLMYSFGILPLVDIYAMIFTIPFLAVILSRIFYSEQTDLRSWLAIIIGFCGVLLVLRPGMDMNIALLGFYPLVITFFLTLPLCISDFMMPDIRQSLHFILSGILVSTAITTVSMAFRITQSHKVTPFLYTEMIWGVLFGYLIFGDIPDALMLAGSGIIIGSGLYVIWYHRKKRHDSPLHIPE